jgi:hypothetical protein
MVLTIVYVTWNYWVMDFVHILYSLFSGEYTVVFLEYRMMEKVQKPSNSELLFTSSIEIGRN